MPIATGSVVLGRIAPWLASEKDLDAQLCLAKQILTEDLAKTHKRVFKAIEEFNPLRGNGKEDVADVLGDFSNMVFRISDSWSELSRARAQFRFWHWLLVATVLLGVVSLPVPAMAEGTSCMIGIVALGLILVQATSIAQCIRLFAKVKSHVQHLA